MPAVGLAPAFVSLSGQQLYVVWVSVAVAIQLATAANALSKLGLSTPIVVISTAPCTLKQPWSAVSCANEAKHSCSCPKMPNCFALQCRKKGYMGFNYANDTGYTSNGTVRKRFSCWFRLCMTRMAEA